MRSLYRMFDDEGRLLYVGQTSGLPRRLDQHRSGRPWWGEVATVTVEHFDRANDVFKAEQQAINTEAPLYNVPLSTASRRGWIDRLARRDAAHDTGQRCSDAGCARCTRLRRLDTIRGLKAQGLDRAGIVEALSSRTVHPYTVHCWVTEFERAAQKAAS
jgi:predicted GIY-YIG superfamily endonuclease